VRATETRKRTEKGLGPDPGTEKRTEKRTEEGLGLDPETEKRTEEDPGLDPGTEKGTEDDPGLDPGKRSTLITNITRTGPDLERDTTRDKLGIALPYSHLSLLFLMMGSKI